MNENNPVSLCKLLRRCDVAWTNFNFCFLMFSYMSFGRGKFKRSQMLPKTLQKMSFSQKE